MKYDLGVLAEKGLSLGGELFDTMIAGYLLRPDRRGNDLGVLSAEYLNEPVVDYDDVLGGQSDLRFVDIARVAQYAGQDAALTWRLFEKLHPLLKDATLLKVFHEIEMPLVPILSAMERDGMLLDTAALARMSAELDVELNQIQAQVFEAAGCEFNLNSPKQLSEILFEKLGLPTKGLKKTKTGISTDSSTLEKLELLHPVPGLLLRHRVLFKLKSTYLDALPTQVSLRDGRLHSSFHQTGTGTGRLSSSEPNLQNIPIQTSEGVRIREAFVAPKGRVLISADYSQIELRVLAHMAKDERLCEAFRRGEDIHTATARELLHLPNGAQVTPEQRRLGKTMNFGVIYGMGPYRLSRELEIPLAEAQRYIENYFGRFSGVDAYLRAQEKAAEGRGFVETIFGRKRFLSDIDTTGRDDQFVARVAMNAPVQGSAADIIKIAMIRLAHSIKAEALPLTLILQVHDELVFECDAARESELSAWVKREMEQVVKLDVPLVVDVGSGANWRVAHG